MGERITLLNRYIRGWMGYFRLADTPRNFADLDEWFRRADAPDPVEGMEETAYPRGQSAKLGAPAQKAWEWGMTSKAYWRISGSPILQRALPNEYWETLGLVFFHAAWRCYRTT